MCWKHEWAMAINKLESAIGHVERGKAKLEKRLARNRCCLERMSRHRKACPSFLAPVQLLIEKNSAGIEECNRVIADLKVRQDQLFRMVHVYGIKRAGNPKRVYELMGKYKVPKAVFEGTRLVFQKKEAS